MEDDRNNRKLEQKMRDVMKRDRARAQVSRINNFGVLMLSRQRMRSSFIESSYVQCPYCKGSGIVPSIQTAAVIMFRHLQDKIAVRSAQKFIMNVPSDVAVYLLNQKRAEIAALEDEFDTEIAIVGDDSIVNIADYTIQRTQKDKPETDELLAAHKPSGDANKKVGEVKKNVKKAVVESRRHRRRRPQKKKSLWQKLINK
jgi:ribonuclease E